jgi:hypothetical protein
MPFLVKEPVGGHLDGPYLQRSQYHARALHK